MKREEFEQIIEKLKKVFGNEGNHETDCEGHEIVDWKVGDIHIRVTNTANTYGQPASYDV